MNRDGEGDGASSSVMCDDREGDEQQEQEQTLGVLLLRTPAPEVPPSQSFSVELFAPPNTQELSGEPSSSAGNMTTATAESHQEQEEVQEDQDVEMNENVIHVREILDDMLRTESSASSVGSLSSSEKDREEKERLQMYQLRCCVIDDANLEELEKLPKRMCAYEFKPGDIAWNCRVCQVDETCVMCNDCFISSDHDDHEVFFYYTQSGGCCDCGDTEAWAAEGFCTSHKVRCHHALFAGLHMPMGISISAGAQDADPLRFLPHDILVNSRACIGEVMKVVMSTIEEARFAHVLDESGVEKVQQKLANASPDARYCVVVHYNEYLSSQEFTTALSLAHPMLPFQMKKLEEIISQRQGIVRTKATREQATELAEALFAHGIYSSIVSNDYVAKLQVMNSLLHWLVSMANLSDGVCRLICEQFILHGDQKEPPAPTDASPSSEPPKYPTLGAVILADAFLPKSGSDALHSLLMALLADPIFKKSFAIAFTSSYPQLYREHVAGVGSVTSTILTFGVQFFNRASFVKLLASEYELLEVITGTILETLRRRPKSDLMEISFDGNWDSLACVLHPEKVNEVSVWDLFALAIQRLDESTLQHVDLSAMEQEAQALGLVVRKASQPSRFLRLPPDTEIPGKCELDVNSPVFLHRRYLCGLLDLRYALQIEGVSEAFVSEKNGSRYAAYLLYLSYVQGIGAEVRRIGDHVETESRAWLFAVEFASTVSDEFTLIVLNAFKNSEAHGGRPRSPAQLQDLITKIAKPIFEAYYFWLASSRKYFPPVDFMVGDTLRVDQVETSVSCHFPLHRTIAQLVRTLSNSPLGLDLFYQLLRTPADKPDQSLWVHDYDSPIGFWHRVHLIEPVLQAIVWDAQVHSGMWVRNGSSVISHSMNYGEPPFCTRFRDVDLLLLQFGFHFMRVDWMMSSITTRFDIEEWFEAESPEPMTELMVTECLTLLCHLASELPPKVSSEDPLRSLTPYLRREIVQRLCVGPCAHSDLSKITTEFFLAHENLFPNNFSSGTILDQILKELCVPPSSASALGGGDPAGGKFQYRLKTELFAEYNPTFIHLSRKQHEFAHENWFQQRLRSSKAREAQQEDGSPNNTHSSWLDFPMVNTFLPCPKGFRITRVSILHADVRRLVYEAFWKATKDPHSSLSLLSRAVHLFTLQLYVIEEVRYVASMPVGVESDKSYLEEATKLVESFVEWVTSEQTSVYHYAESHPPILDLLLKLNPWSVSSGGEGMVTLDGDQKHEIGRGVDWLLHRLSRIDDGCRDLILKYQLTQKASKEEEDRKLKLAQRRKEAQMRAMLQMQRQQAAFAEQMKSMMGDGARAGGEDDEEVDAVAATQAAEASTTVSADAGGDVDMGGDDAAAQNEENALPECAMCHSVDSEDSFMCYIGFAQCSPVFSRLNGGNQGRFLSTPIDEMHVGEDVPIHVRLCGHSVHHTCWESYHQSQFQRAITGGHHRHALNAVDVTKNEFLCPLCKSISNVLIPTTANEMNDASSASEDSEMTDAHSQSSSSANGLTDWLVVNGKVKEEEENEGDGVADESEQKAEFPAAESAAPIVRWGDNTPQKRWLEQGLSSLCMAIHRVACGAMQQSRPERYTTSGCNALYHTLLCTFLSTQENDQIKPEQRLLQAMRFLPQMLDQVARPKPWADTSANGIRKQICHLLYYGGSDVLKDGSIVLETEHPSTQTQTRKQSQWGKVRCPAKPLLLNHLGSVLAKGFLLARNEQEAVYICRLAVLARVVQTLMWYAVTRNEEFTDSMAENLEYSEENVKFFIESFFEDSHATSEDSAADQLVALLNALTSPCSTAFPHVLDPVADKKKLLNIVACEVVPMVRVAVFLLKSRPPHALPAMAKPSGITSHDVRDHGFIKVGVLLPADSELRPILTRWVERFQAAYEEMNDSHGILQQWLTGANADKPPSKSLSLTNVLGRDLHTMHSTISLFASGSSRTRYLRSLPRAYVKFYSELAKRKCESCNQFPARPAVCLLCGALLCAANTCPSLKTENGYREESNPGACTVHAKKCGRGSGMFLLVLEGAVLLVYWKLSAYVGSLYVDEYGEEFGERNRELNKGRPLYLNEERRERLLRLWLRHEIPYEVVKIQNSSERVIRNSHY